MGREPLPQSGSTVWRRTGSGMPKRLRTLLLSIQMNSRVAVLYSVLELLFFLSSAMFSICLVSYFGITPHFLARLHLLELFESQHQLLLLVGAFLSLVALVARVVQGYLGAKTISGQEYWFGRQLRSAKHQDLLKANPSKDVARASQYYGRLSGAGLNVASAASTLALTVLALPIFLSFKLVVWGLLFVALSGAALYLLSIPLSKLVSGSSVGLTSTARAAALWKMDPDLSTDESVADFYRHYFYRIFLVGVFSYTGLAFSFLFVVLLLVVETGGLFTPAPGSVLLAFMIIRLYIGLISRLMSNIVKSAAFSPHVETFSEVIGGESSPVRKPLEGSASVAAKKNVENDSVDLEDF